MKNNKTIIAYLYKKKSSGLTAFESHYEKLKKNSKKLGYHLSPSVKNDIVFLSDSLTSKIVKKLISFLHISPNS